MPAVSLTHKDNLIKRMARNGISDLAKVFWKRLPQRFYLDKSILKLDLALTRVCNINCCFCPYQITDHKEKIHMSPRIFEKILKDIEDAKIRRVMLSPDLGEPLLAPDFIKKIISLRQFGITEIEVTTNGTRFHRIGIEKLLKEGPDIINISFPGFDNEMYERICKKPFYEQARANILGLLRKNNELGRPKRISLWLRGDLGDEDLMAFPEMSEVEKLADEICMMTEVDDWLGLVKQEMLPPGLRIQKKKPKLTKRPCAILFDLTIHPDGDIHLCSCRNIVRDPDLHIGNILNMSIQQAFEKIPDIFERWESGHFPSICKRCLMYCDPAVSFAGRFRQIANAKFLKR